MNNVWASSFTVSDVRPARQSLYEIPYPHALAGLIGARVVFHDLYELDREIGHMEHILSESQRELAAPLPFWMEDGRRAGFPEEADAELARRQESTRDTEQKLAALKQRRAQRFAELDASQQTVSHDIEACSRYHGRLVADVAFHPVMAALHHAFGDHRPICLSPDMIWLLIAQGAANHINAHAETLRPRFVRHQGKVRLVVRRDDFIKGSPENPWAEVFPAFTEKIRGHLGDATHDFFVANFSTTRPVERAAFEVVLMDAMQSYFTYVLRTVCGIPAITLEGTPDDWRAVLDRARMLPRFDLDWWLPVLEPILRRFIDAAEGRPDPEFWQSIYKYHSFSGGNAVTGWITAFFPYFKDPRTSLPTLPNPWLARAGKDLQGLLYPGQESEPCVVHGPALDQFPAGLARAPLLWEYLDQEFDMEFLGGFVGVAQDSHTLCLRPEIGWAVREVMSREPKPRRDRDGG
jgi:hypothetical protein